MATFVRGRGWQASDGTFYRSKDEALNAGGPQQTTFSDGSTAATYGTHGLIEQQQRAGQAWYDFQGYLKENGFAAGMQFDPSATPVKDASAVRYDERYGFVTNRDNLDIPEKGLFDNAMRFTSILGAMYGGINLLGSIGGMIQGAGQAAVPGASQGLGHSINFGSGFDPVSTVYNPMGSGATLAGATTAPELVGLSALDLASLGATAFPVEGGWYGAEPADWMTRSQPTMIDKAKQAYDTVKPAIDIASLAADLLIPAGAAAYESEAPTPAASTEVTEAPGRSTSTGSETLKTKRKWQVGGLNINLGYGDAGPSLNVPERSQ